MRGAEKDLGALDLFRLAAALLVICIHTSPLESVSADGDLFLTRILARVAVPFFFMTTGYFADFSEPRGLRRPLLKTAALYGFSILLYIPFGIYSGYFGGFSFGAALRMLIFDGTFYHLWYFPAVIAGMLIVYALKKLTAGKALVIALVLYVFGLLGDSYYALGARALPLRVLYNVLFELFSYTRNGLFFAPVFLLLGSMLRGKGTCGVGEKIENLGGLTISFTLMTAEGLLLHGLKIPRHDSMYVFLLPTAFFLFRLLLSVRIGAFPVVRQASAWVYIVHPIVIILLRGAAKALNRRNVFERSSLLGFALTAVISVVIGFAAALTVRRLKRGRADCRRARAWAEIDLAALKNNLGVLRSRLPEYTELMPAVKADGYGHGAVTIARELNRLGVRAFCTACASEGAELRRNGVRGEILVLGYTAPEQLYLLKKHRLSQTVVDLEYAKLLGRFGGLRVHVGIDTGMHRLGIPYEDFDGIASVFRMDGLSVVGMFTHLAADDTPFGRDRDFTERQTARFRQVAEGLKALGYRPRIHLQSSLGVLNYPELAADIARTGLALYGCVDGETGRGLRPVMSLKARVSSVRFVRRGECIGYGTEYAAERDMKIAALTVGYADGLPRALSDGRGYVLINGVRAPVAGKICMDQTLVDVSGLDVRQGDTAVVIGASGGDAVTVCGMARLAGTIPNEILTGIGKRVLRITVG